MNEPLYDTNVHGTETNKQLCFDFYFSLFFPFLVLLTKLFWLVYPLLSTRKYVSFRNVSLCNISCHWRRFHFVFMALHSQGQCCTIHTYCIFCPAPGAPCCTLQYLHLFISPYGKIFKILFRSFHRDTDRGCCVQTFVKCCPWEIVRYLPDRKKISAASQTVATARIALKICKGQPPIIYAQCSRFHPNWFTFGVVIAERGKHRFCPVEYFYYRLFEPIISYWHSSSLHCVWYCTMRVRSLSELSEQARFSSIFRPDVVYKATKPGFSYPRHRMFSGVNCVCYSTWYLKNRHRRETCLLSHKCVCHYFVQ